MMAAKYKKAVICQKPMANTFEECLEMVKACDEAGVWFAMHENFRFKRSFARLREYLDSQALGKLYRADLIFRTPKGSRLRESPYLMAMDHMALRDMGCHVFDLTRFLFGEASSIYCGLTSTCPDPDVHVQDTMISLLKMKNGMLVKSEGCNDRKAQLFISGEKGTITMDAANRVILNIEGREETLDPPALVKPDYIPQRSWDYHGGEGMLAIRACLETLIAAYQKNEPAYSSGHEYLKTMELVFRAIASTDDNRVVQLELTK
jgi:predicted dehydrogenase